MARLSRIVVPDLPHHVAQRGNRRQPLFVEPGDYALYRDLLAERCRANGVVCWAYCLMPNHVHLILVPAAADGLAKAVGEAHRRFTAFANARARVTGHLFQGRFSSRAMDEPHLVAAARYLALNPVSAGLVADPADWPASSVAAHLAGRDDALATVAPLLSRIPRFADLFEPWPEEAAARAAFEAGAATGRPLGDEGFVAAIEAKLRRRVRPAKRGPKPRANAAAQELGI
jgi:putative transposase